MPLFSRPDGKLATGVPPSRRIMPYIMRTRNESAVYFEQEVDITRTLEFIERFNATRPRRITLFHVFLWAAVRVLRERPRLNRFVSGNRIYQRDGIWISYSAKKALTDDAPIVVLKRRFDPTLSFEALVDFVRGDVDKGRSDEKSHLDKELALFLRLPGPILRWGIRLVRWLDRWNLLPGSFIHPDPMYASLFIANLGSVKLESAYHHLYEYGNIPLFAAIGRRKVAPAVDAEGRLFTRQICSIKYSLDERVEDGLYCAGALELLRSMIEDPSAHGAAHQATVEAKVG
ncbi:MAG: hypothetical protein HYZ28_01865 [Myxococcales bacterium]|nr:hypothetical protein [Myxococcales bacterium]